MNLECDRCEKIIDTFKEDSHLVSIGKQRKLPEKEWEYTYDGRPITEGIDISNIVPLCDDCYVQKKRK